MTKNLNVLFLAGGFGTRLAQFYPNTPKALLEIDNGKRLLDFLIEKVDNELVNSKINLISNDKYYKDFLELGINVINNGVEKNEDRLGSIGDILYFLENEKDVMNSDLLVIGTDNYFEEDLLKMINGDNVKIMAYDCLDLENAKKYGTVIVDENNYVKFFEEKPEMPKTTLVSTMIYFIPKEKLNLLKHFRIDRPDELDRAGNFLHYLNEEGKKIEVAITNKKWFDIGSIEELDKLRDSLEAKKVKY